MQQKLGTRSNSLYLSLNENVEGEGTEYISSDNYLYDKNETWGVHLGSSSNYTLPQSSLLLSLDYKWLILKLVK